MVTQEKPKLIGAIASESGISIKTIRYYDELGLLKTNGRTEGGYRLFDSDVLYVSAILSAGKDGHAQPLPLFSTG